MSEVILCQVPRAEQPFYAEDIDLNLYSIEELCYFMQGNLALLSSDFFNSSLTDWLRDELHLPRLAKTLEENRKEDTGLKALVFPIFREIGWLTPSQARELTAHVEELEQLPAAVRLKQKGDALAGYEKYTRAISCYQLALRLSSETSSVGEQFKGTVYYNAGAAAARLFQMEEACACMKKAYQLVPSEDTLRGWLFCIWLKDGKEAFLQKCQELKVEDPLREEMEKKVREIPNPAFPVDVDAALAVWVREYHRQTDL